MQLPGVIRANPVMTFAVYSGAIGTAGQRCHIHKIAAGGKVRRLRIKVERPDFLHQG
jgi:hypothetical protein